MQSVHPEVQSYLDQVVTTLTIYLGADLIGVYLHGSLAMGSFDPGRSDIDILAVCAEPLHHERRTVLGEALAAIPTPPPVAIWSSAWSPKPQCAHGLLLHPSRCT
jgi:predicted nucleotidyltransferase